MQTENDYMQTSQSLMAQGLGSVHENEYPSLHGPRTGSGGMALCMSMGTAAYLGLVLSQGLSLVHGNEDLGQKLLVLSFQRKSKAIDDAGKMGAQKQASAAAREMERARKTC